jgi:sterol 3beta-glucosyltransferase
MVITILTAGSRGDIQPYIALGLELKKAGHAVRMVTFENYETFVKSFGLEFYPIKGDVSMVASSESVSDAKKADNPLKVFLSFNKLKSYVFDLQKEFFNACAGSDAIVYHPGVSIGYFAAQHLKIPSILATPFPMTPTKDYPSVLFYDKLRLGRGYNLITHKIFEKIMWFASSSAVKQFWKKEFGKAPDDFSCPFSKQTTKNLPTVVSCRLARVCL